MTIFSGEQRKDLKLGKNNTKGVSHSAIFFLGKYKTLKHVYEDDYIWQS